jgi:hypothetical protein
MAAVLTGLCAAIAYLATMSQSVGWHDSAELALVAWQLGASHAPGSPVHSVTGHLLTLIADEPHLATTGLSVLSATLTAMVLSVLLFRVSGSVLVSFSAALLYAFSFQVWASAVVTEVYSLGMLFLSATLLAVWCWLDDRSLRNMVLVSSLYAVSLGAYFANILLFPIFLGLIFLTSPARRRDLSVFLLALISSTLLIAAANYSLSLSAPPTGEIIPDSPGNMLLYMSGAQHNPLEFRDALHWIGRIWQHSKIFSASIVWAAIPLGLAGVCFLDSSNKLYNRFLALVFAVNFFYYTLFGPGDYYLMVLPAYFVFVIWVACGANGVIALLTDRSHQLIGSWLLILLPGSLFALQFSDRHAAASLLEPEHFAEQIFTGLPHNSIVIVGWKEFTTLRYFQEIGGQRADLRVILPARSLRHYSFGDIDDYMTYISAEICDFPVYTTKDLPDLDADYRLQDVATTDLWQKINVRDEIGRSRCARKQN